MSGLGAAARPRSLPGPRVAWRLPLTRMMLALLLAFLLLPPAAVLAADEEPEIEFLYPLVTRRPVIEREVELRVRHEKTGEGRETEVAAAIEWPVLPRWQIEVEVPALFRDPRDGNSTGGTGDVTVETKALVLKSVQHRALIALGVEGTFPTGSERRDLGGEAAIEPFVTGGIAVGPFDLLGEIAYEWNLNAHVHGEREQEFHAGTAVGYRVLPWLTPLVEVTTATRVRGSEDEEPGKRPRASIIPGFNVRPYPGVTARFGIELPLTDARSSDYTLHTGIVWEF